MVTGENNFQMKSEQPQLIMSSTMACIVAFSFCNFLFPLLFCEHIFVHSSVNISAMHMWH